MEVLCIWAAQHRGDEVFVYGYEFEPVTADYYRGPCMSKMWADGKGAVKE